ncbi:putative ribosomal protein l32 protein [Podospora conica]|nr:putative ribosomal protein l32 protein [Schizothecium conicum]
MASTMTMSAAPTTFSSSDCCPQCGFKASFSSHSDDTSASLLAAQQQITALEAQVRLLNEKASAAVDRWADYEDELAKLRRQLNTHSPIATTASTPGPTPLHTPSASVASPARSSFLSSGAASRISALLSPRKSTPNLRGPASPPQPPPPPLPPARYNNSLPLHPSPAIYSPAPTPGPEAEDLAAALAREQALRRAAEGRLSDTSREVEELSVSLFEQANEMVATERRARARLEERVEMLERRDTEKHRRLERLEGAMERIDRVRGVLAQGGGLGPSSGAGNRSTL